jgi:hypothetical protein
MKMGGKGIFEPGDWMVHYNTAKEELTVKISLKHFYVELGKGTLDGKATDIFAGPISQEDNVWLADWNGFPEYTAHTSEHPDFILTDGSGFGMTKSLVFEKVDE